LEIGFFLPTPRSLLHSRSNAVTIAGMTLLSRAAFNGLAASPGAIEIGITIEGGFPTNDFSHFGHAQVGDCTLVKVQSRFFRDVFFHFDFGLNC